MISNAGMHPQSRLSLFAILLLLISSGNLYGIGLALWYRNDVVYFGGWFSRCLMRCYSTCRPDAFRLIRLKATRLNRGRIRQAHEKIAGTLTGRAFFIAVIACCLTVCTFVPVGSLGSDCVHAAATLFVTDFGTTTVCDPQVVTSGATVRTTGNR